MLRSQSTHRESPSATPLGFGKLPASVAAPAPAPAPAVRKTDTPWRGRLVLLPPNRVWRTYPGGRTLDELAGAAAPADSHLAEDWIASTTRAVNPPDAVVPETHRALLPSPGSPAGISRVLVGHDPTPHDFAQLLAADPEYFLGAAHVRNHGAQPQVLVKFLDSGTRLHFQVHPTRDFARRLLGAPSGKTEAYHVLSTRPDTTPSPPAPRSFAAPATPVPVSPHPSPAPAHNPSPITHHPAAGRPSPAHGAHRQSPITLDPAAGSAGGYIYVGFQRPPTPAQLRDYIVTQDIAAIAACFDPIPVRPGDTFIIPGGTPHALGPGVFMVEIQEPSDLVVRFEFERAGYVLPEASRFMNRDVDFALTVFDFSPLTAADIATRVRCRPRRLRALGPGSHQDEFIGPAQTDCFRVARTHLGGPVVKEETGAVIAIVTHGAVTATVGGESHRIDTYQKFFIPAGLGPVRLAPLGDAAEILECFPPA